MTTAGRDGIQKDAEVINQSLLVLAEGLSMVLKQDSSKGSDLQTLISDHHPPQSDQCSTFPNNHKYR